MQNEEAEPQSGGLWAHQPSAGALGQGRDFGSRLSDFGFRKTDREGFFRRFRRFAQIDHFSGLLPFLSDSFKNTIILRPLSLVLGSESRTRDENEDEGTRKGRKRTGTDNKGRIETNGPLKINLTGPVVICRCGTQWQDNHGINRIDWLGW